MNKEAGLIYIDEVGSESIARIKKILAGVPQGAYKAIGSAMARAAATAKTHAAKAIVREYTITQGTFRNHVKNINHFKTSEGVTTVEFGFRGYVIPLISFDTTISQNGKIQARVKRGSAKKELDNAFIAQLGGHTGVYERKGAKRFPIKQLYGPSAAQMIDYNDDLSNEIGDKIVETYEKRIEHEITRILNGYGV